MPPGGAAARGRQGATLSRLRTRSSIDPALGRLLDALRRLCRRPALRLRRRQPDPRRPARLREGDQGARRVRRRAGASTARPPTTPGRARGRPTTSPPCGPILEKTLDLSREYAGFFAPYEHIADPLIDGADEGMTTALGAHAVRRAARASWCRSCARSPSSRRPTTAACAARSPRRRSSPSASIAVKRFGYDFERGRQDKTHHPFCTKFSRRRRAHHHARARGRPRRRAVLDRCTRPATRCTSRASTPRSKARRWAPAPRPACTRASRGCGRTWSAAAAASGSTSTRAAAGLSRPVRRACRSTPSTAPSTRSSAR